MHANNLIKCYLGNFCVFVKRLNYYFHIFTWLKMLSYQMDSALAVKQFMSGHILKKHSYLRFTHFTQKANIWDINPKHWLGLVELSHSCSIYEVRSGRNSYASSLCSHWWCILEHLHRWGMFFNKELDLYLVWGLCMRRIQQTPSPSSLKQILTNLEW